MFFSWHEEVLEGATPAWTGLKDSVKRREWECVAYSAI